MLKVSVSGIRGVWGISLTHEILLDYLKAYVKTLGKNKKIALGTDTRKTRDIIKELTISLLLSYGYEIIDLGIVPTPLVLFLVKENNLDGGIMISASHNPPDWNALKLITKGGFFLNQRAVDKLIETYTKKDFLSYSYKDLGKVKQEFSILDQYLKKAKNLVDFKLIQNSMLKIVMDGVNGTANQIFPALFQTLNLTYHAIFTDIDKEFERGAEPLPENLKELGKEVVKNKADIGLAYDPDGDRLALVDENGSPVGEDWTLAIAYLNLLSKEKSDTVINYSTSMIIDEIANLYHKNVIRAKVGEINVTEKMLEKNISIGGEGNGGVIYTKINNCRDSLIATLLVLEYLAKSKKKLSQIICDFPKIYLLKDKIPFTGVFNSQYYENILLDILAKSGLSVFDINREDGIRIDYQQGWIQIRASNTEPIIRIMGESKNKNLIKNIFENIKNEFTK